MINCKLEVDEITKGADSTSTGHEVEFSLQPDLAFVRCGQQE